jgi:hypothetical protein
MHRLRGREPNGNLWMKLEYLEGSTLRELLHREGRMPVERASGLAGGRARA